MFHLLYANYSSMKLGFFLKVAVRSTKTKKSSMDLVTWKSSI